jgi:ABC-type amino acid transport system permease subunit
MKKFRLINRTTIPYITVFVLGLLILPIAVKAASRERGYNAAGGELLIPFLFILIQALANEIKTFVKEVVR